MFEKYRGFGKKRKTHTPLSRNTNRGVFYKLQITRLWGCAPNPL